MINFYDVIIAQPFACAVALASFILRHECDDYVIFGIKNRSQPKTPETVTEAGFYNKHKGTHDVNIQMT